MDERSSIVEVPREQVPATRHHKDRRTPDAQHVAPRTHG
jgi:hypothetical protein